MNITIGQIAAFLGLIAGILTSVSAIMLFIQKPSIDFYPGVKVTKDTVLEYENESRVAIYHGKLIQTEWKPTEAFSYALQGLDLDSVWNNLIIQIGNIQMDEGNSIDEQIAVDEQRAKLLKEIDRLEKLARAEKQPKKKFELVQQINQLRKELT